MMMKKFRNKIETRFPHIDEELHLYLPQFLFLDMNTLLDLYEKYTNKTLTLNDAEFKAYKNEILQKILTLNDDEFEAYKNEILQDIYDKMILASSFSE